MPVGTLGAAVQGFVWGALCATVGIRRHRVRDAAWLVLTPLAVAAAATWLGGWTAGVAGAGGVVSGWLIRRTLESVVEGRR